MLSIFQDLSQDSIIKQKDKQKEKKGNLKHLKFSYKHFLSLHGQLPIDIKYKSIQIKFFAK